MVIFFMELTYKEPISVVEAALPLHNQYLDRNYKLGNFIFSGRKDPRNGGVILANVADLKDLENIYHEDPFFRQGIADYKILNFTPTKMNDVFAQIPLR